MNAGPGQGVVGEISATALRKRVVYLVLESYLVRSNRSLKINRGGVLSCVTYGSRVDGLLVVVWTDEWHGWLEKLRFVFSYSS